MNEGKRKAEKTSFLQGKNQLQKKNRKEREKLKKSNVLHKKKRRKRRVDKKIIMSADELKQRGNEAFKVNDFKLACELFTEAIGLDSTNHVLYSNRSAARVILIICIFCAYTVVYIFEAFFDRLHLFEMRLLFLVRKE